GGLTGPRRTVQQHTVVPWKTETDVLLLLPQERLEPFDDLITLTISQDNRLNRSNRDIRGYAETCPLGCGVVARAANIRLACLFIQSIHDGLAGILRSTFNNNGLVTKSCLLPGLNLRRDDVHRNWLPTDRDFLTAVSVVVQVQNLFRVVDCRLLV